MSLLRRIALACFGRFATYHPYADPAAIGYDLAVALPVLGTVAFRPYAPRRDEPAPLVFNW